MKSLLVGIAVLIGVFAAITLLVAPFFGIAFLINHFTGLSVGSVFAWSVLVGLLVVFAWAVGQVIEDCF